MGSVSGVPAFLQMLGIDGSALLEIVSKDTTLPKRSIHQVENIVLVILSIFITQFTWCHMRRVHTASALFFCRVRVQFSVSETTALWVNRTPKYFDWVRA